ncbi:MAG: hypothetical protein OHK0046_44700 [Anaerolineae bacterium]
MVTIVTDATLDSFLCEPQPKLILFSAGDDLRSEFSVAFKKAVTQHPQIAFAQVHPAENPAAAARFNVGSKAVLIGVHNGQELVRRPRPWGTDIPLAVEMLMQAAPAMPEQQQTESKENTLVETQPIDVTDQTFQQEVIDYELPVVVDFWAEWCGPCRMVSPILEKLAGEYAGQVRVAKVNVDENPGLSQAFRIMSIPNIMMIKNRTIVFNQPGALPEHVMRDLFNQLLNLEVPEPELEEQTEAAESTPEDAN